MTQILPPTLPGAAAPIHWELIWPGHPRIDVWLQSMPAPDFVFDRHQVAAVLGFDITPELSTVFPAEWCYPVPVADEVLRMVEMWSRTTSLQVARERSPFRELAHSFAEWVEDHRRILAHDFEGAVQSSIPGLSAGYGAGFEIAEIANRLSTRYGHISRDLCFSRMQALGWVEKLRDAGEMGRYRPTQYGLTHHLVFARPRKIAGRKSTYSQVLITSTGFALLEEDIRLLADVDGHDLVEVDG